MVWSWSFKMPFCGRKSRIGNWRFKTQMKVGFIWLCDLNVMKNLLISYFFFNSISSMIWRNEFSRNWIVWLVNRYIFFCRMFWNMIQSVFINLFWLFLLGFNLLHLVRFLFLLNLLQSFNSSVTKVLTINSFHWDCLNFIKGFTWYWFYHAFFTFLFKINELFLVSWLPKERSWWNFLQFLI